MRGEHFYGYYVDKRPRVLRGRPAEPRGSLATGRIRSLSVGQGFGFIRSASDDDIYFHRSDVQDGASINDFSPGDAVAFELLTDHVSGPRALRVRRC